ncbi:MAG: hypothetical protein JOZ13_10025 [Alphaproteobacteria bacterium]|nr:hypothetical protein [Alphaproteobacteria bacterium]
MSETDMGSGIAGPEEIATFPALAQHATRMVLPLSRMIDDFVAESGLPDKHPLAKFLNHVKSHFSDEQYAKIQRTHLSRENLERMRRKGHKSLEHKYLDFPYWMRSKFKRGQDLQLRSHAGQPIIDIGAGPGHFGLVANYFGCDYWGLEMPLQPWSGTPRHVFDDLTEFFQINRIIHEIHAEQKIESKRRYRILTCLMGNFCAVPTPEGKTRPWTWNEWSFFLENLISDILLPEHVMYFNINREHLSKEAKEKIRQIASTYDEERSFFSLKNLELAQIR